MIDIKNWINIFLPALNDAFGKRVWFVGLQGSYGRGEATENSDIDIVVILDKLSSADVKAYDAMLDTLPHKELICGFFSGKNELFHWEPSDLFQFYFDTTPIQGNLDELLPMIDEGAIRRAVKIAVCNIFHSCTHNMLYEKSTDLLKSLYKSASFVIQAIYYQKTGNYIRRQRDLIPLLSPREQAIINTFLYLKKGSAVDFQTMSETLFDWSKIWIEKTN